MDANTNPAVSAWRRSAEIADRLCAHLVADRLDLAPAEGESTIREHLVHLYHVRVYWLRQASPTHAEGLKRMAENADLASIVAAIRSSGAAVASALEAMESEAKPGPYEDVGAFLGHLVWHDGWHAGLIMLALRRGGHEPEEIWEERNLWEVWRGVGTY